MKNSGSQGAAFAQLNDYGQAAGLLIGKLSDHGNILCAVQHGSHSTEVATEHLKCGRLEREFSIFYLIVINVPLNSHTWLVAIVLDNAALYFCTHLEGLI